MLRLVYTSAPRLLDVGKTGFGTVACTQGMPRPLVSYLERISAFDRAAAVASLQFYSTYRMGAVVFHVFSRVGDCEADYTGRTNHLAEHYVVEDATPEFAALAKTTPAGVLLGLQERWIPRWDAHPQRFAECELPGFMHQASFGEWALQSGDEENARWLASTHIAIPCCLVLPTGVDNAAALRLLHDGMLCRADHGWGCHFSTAVTSTLRGQVFRCLSAVQQQAGVNAGRDPLLHVAFGLTPPPAAVTTAETAPPPSEAAAESEPLPEWESAPSFTDGLSQAAETIPPIPSSPLPRWADEPVVGAPLLAKRALQRPKRQDADEEEKNYMPWVWVAVTLLLILLMLFWQRSSSAPVKAEPANKPTATSAENKPKQNAPASKKAEPAPTQERKKEKAGKEEATQEAPAPQQTPAEAPTPPAAHDTPPEPPQAEPPAPQQTPAEGMAQAATGDTPPESQQPTAPQEQSAAPATTPAPTPAAEKSTDPPAKESVTTTSPEPKKWRLEGNMTERPGKGQDKDWNKNISFVFSTEDCVSHLGIPRTPSTRFFFASMSADEGLKFDTPPVSGDEMPDKLCLKVKAGQLRCAVLEVNLDRMDEEGNAHISVRAIAQDCVEDWVLGAAKDKVKKAESVLRQVESSLGKAEEKLQKPRADLKEAQKAKDKGKAEKARKKLENLQKPGSKIAEARAALEKAQKKYDKAKSDFEQLELKKKQLEQQ